jgi:hypothetical protein
MQITYTAHAWVDTTFSSVDLVLNGKATPSLSSQGPGQGGYFEREGHVCIGQASVTVDVNAADKIVADQIHGLNAKLQAVRAEAQQKENQILLQISKLQALTMS